MPMRFDPIRTSISSSIACRKHACGRIIMITTITLIVAEITTGSIWLAAFGVLLLLTLIIFGVRFIPNDRVGIIEKLWSLKGSVGEGRIIACNGQAGYEPS